MSDAVSGTGQARILIVEDEQIVAMDLQDKLEAMGYQVVGRASSGAGAVAQAERLRPDLVLMDVRLDGEMDGIEAARLIHQRLAVPVVYLTAYSGSDVVDRAMQSAPFGYVLKPYNDRELTLVIEVALDRHRTQRLLAERELLLACTLRSIGDAVLCADAGGRVSFLNPVAERLTGWSLDDARGRPAEEVFRIVNELTGALVESPLARALRERQPVPLANHTILVGRDGRRLPIDDVAAPILDQPPDSSAEVPEVRGGVLVFRDVTQQRAAMQSTSRMAAIVDASEDAILSQSVEGMITSWNTAAQQLYGYAAEEVVGRPFHLLAPEQRYDEMRAIAQKARDGEPVVSFQTKGRCRDGSEIDVLLSLSPLRDEAGEIIGSAAIVREVTQLRQLEEQQSHAQKMEAVGRLAGGIAHDFNNLLTVINGCTSLVLSQLPPQDRLRELLEPVVRAGDRAAVLTRQLLAYSRRQLMQPRVIDLNDLVHQAEKHLRTKLGQNVALRLELAGSLPAVKVDPTQMEQAILNLAANAREAMPGGGALTIETFRMGNGEWRMANEEKARRDAAEPPPSSHSPFGEWVALRLSDTGAGMTPDVLARVFEPFFTTKEVGQGTGLGLAMVYGVVKQSAGHVTAHSRPGEGSAFTIYLPAINEEKAEPASSALAGLPRGIETVLLVEDEEAVRTLTVHLLSQSGYAVLPASDGESALQLLAGHKGPVDLLITDVVMPRLSGPQVAAAVRARYPQVKVLYQSGSAGDELRRHGVTIDSNFLAKPFTPSQLSEKVREVLKGTAGAG
jgi:two-component system, cell cycle sensor histidine kinase and response regulator CckA